MSLWEQWVKNRRRLSEADDSSAAADKFKFNAVDDDMGVDYERTQTELFQAVFSKYPEETMEFLQGIANRGDEEVSVLMNKLNKQHMPSSSRVKHPREKEEFVPSSADVGQADVSQ